MKVFLTSSFSVLSLDIRTIPIKKARNSAFSVFLAGHAHLTNVWFAEIKRENLPNERSIRIRLEHLSRKIDFNEI